MAVGDPLLLEEVLLRHKRLRLFVMHAGWPRLDSMLALLYGHPNVYVDVAALQAPFIVPRSGYFRYLRELVEAALASASCSAPTFLIKSARASTPSWPQTS
jgi:predicted TIM-barrel fold metal-dependent hydrolase